MSASGAAATCPQSFWQRLDPARVFLALALPFGLAALFINPPFQAPDECDHFYRAFQLSEGVILGERHGLSAGGDLPSMAVGIAYTEEIPFHPERKMTRAILRRKLNPVFTEWSGAPRSYCHFPHTVFYPPIAYVPQALTIAIAKAAHAGPLLLMYAARLAGFGVSLTLGYAALKRAKAYPWTLLILILAPMSLYLMGSIATDGLLIGGAFLVVAMAAEYARGPSRPSRRELVLMLSICALLATAKLVYLPLAVAAGVFPLLRLEGRQQRALFVGAFIGVCIAPTIVWSQLAADLYAPGRTDIPIDPHAQTQFILSQPIKFLALVMRTIYVDGRGIYEWFVGTLGWGDTVLSAWYYQCFGAALLVCMCAESTSANGLAWWHRSVFLGAAGATILLIFAAQYITWNAPGAERTIDGICGRYFLPVAPFVVLAFPALKRLRFPDGAAPASALLASSIGAVVCIVAMTRRFYLP